MDITLNDILPAVLGVLVCAWAWFTTKDAATRKYIISLGICWLVLGITYNIGKHFDIPALRGVMGLVGLLALLGSIYFLIRYLLSERKANKKSSDE